MFNIKTLNKISDVGLSKFDTAKYVYGDSVENPDAVMVRSASMHDMEMPQSLLAIARAGAGVNNIPVADCTDKVLLFSIHRVQMQMLLRSLLFAVFFFQAVRLQRLLNGAKQLRMMKM